MAAPGGWELVTEVDAQNPVLGDLRVRGTRLAKLETFGDAVAQQCRVHVKTLLGEWFLNTRIGLPYLQTILKKGVTAATVRAIMRRELLRVEGVARVLTMNVVIDRATRACSIEDVVVVTTEGDELELASLEGVAF